MPKCNGCGNDELFEITMKSPEIHHFDGKYLQEIEPMDYTEALSGYTCVECGSSDVSEERQSP